MVPCQPPTFSFVLRNLRTSVAHATQRMSFGASPACGVDAPPSGVVGLDVAIGASALVRSAPMRTAMVRDAHYK